MTTLVVAGSRDLTDADYPSIVEAIDRWCTQYPIEGRVVIVEGGCRGADSLAARYWNARASRIGHKTMRADWRAHGRAAGPIRNQAMIELADGLVVVRFPDSRGSADILRRAKAKGIPIVDVVLERPALAEIEKGGGG